MKLTPEGSLPLRNVLYEKVFFSFVSSSNPFFHRDTRLRTPARCPVVEYASGPGPDPRRHAHKPAWKISSSSRRAFDAVSNRLTTGPPVPGLAVGLPGPQLGCNSPGAVGGDQLPALASMSPAIRSQGSRQPCFFLMDFFARTFLLTFHFPPRWDHVNSFDRPTREKEAKLKSK